MPRVPRLNIENALYYVTSRGDSSEEIFKEGSDYTMYLDLLKKCKEESKFKLFAFCLVPTHLHLLIELAGATTISQIMHSLNSNYTKYFNSRHNRTGHLFQERYRLVLVEKEPNLLGITAYINLNPKSLDITKDAATYAYSSYPLYIEEGNGNQRTKEPKNQRTRTIDMRSEIKEVASHLKGRAYREFMTGVSSADMEKLGRTLAKKPVLGSEDFVEKIRSKLETEKGKAAEITEAKVRESRAFRQLVIAGGVIVGILGVAALSLFVRAIIMKKNIKEDIAKKDVEIIEKVAEEKQKIRRDLDEKYRADMVSYQALSKRLELEKARARELEAELKDTKGEFKHK